MSNEVPEGWQACRLGDVFTERDEPGESGLPTLTVTMRDGIKRREDLDRRVVSELEPEGHLLARSGDIVYNMMRMWQGASGLACEDGLVSPAYVVATPTARMVPEFAAKLLRSPPMIRLLHGYSQGVTGDRLRLYFQNFASIPVTVPPLSEQRKIAEILTSVDEAIQATEAVIEQTKKVKREVMNRLLTNGIGHTRFKQTEIGEIPEKWGLAPAHELCSRISVGIVVKPAQYYVEGGVPAFRSANVGAGFVRDEDWVYISEQGHKANAKSRLCAGDVLVVRTGYPGTACVVPQKYDGANCIDVIFARPDQNLMISRYLCDFINSDMGRNQVLRAEGGLAQKHFNVGEMKKMLCPCPPIDEQVEIGRQIHSLAAVIAMEECNREFLIRTKSALMSELLTGQKRVLT